MNLNKLRCWFTFALLFVCQVVSAAPNWGGIGSGDDWGWDMLAIILIAPLPLAFTFSLISRKKKSRVLVVLSIFFTCLVWYESFMFRDWAWGYICCALAALCFGMSLSKLLGRSIGSRFFWLSMFVIILYLFAAKYFLGGIMSLSDLQRYMTDNVDRITDWIYRIGFLLLQVYFLTRFMQQRRSRNLPPYSLFQSLGVGLLTGAGAWLICIVFLPHGLEMVLRPFTYRASLLYIDASIWLLAGLLVFALSKRSKVSNLEDPGKNL